MYLKHGLHEADDLSILNKNTKIPSVFKSMEQGGIYNIILTNNE